MYLCSLYGHSLDTAKPTRKCVANFRPRGGGEWRDRGPMKGGGATKGGEDNVDREGGVYYYFKL